MRNLLQYGYILHSKPFKETSAIIQAFTRDFGVVSMVAKGIRRKNSPLKGMLQAFNLLLLSWSGRTDLKTLIAAEAKGQTVQLSGMVLFSGLYINELLLRLLKPYDAHPKLFYYYQNAIKNIASLRLELEEQDDVEIILRIFEKNLLTEIGYGLDLDKCAMDDSPIRIDSTYGFDPNIGIYDLEDFKGTKEQILISGKTLIALKNEQFDNKQQLKEAKCLTRCALRAQLGNRPLYSRELARDIYQGVKVGEE